MATPEVVANSNSHPGKSSNISIHFGVSDEEKVAVKNRGQHVLRTMKKMGLNVKKGPVVSILASGGGLRAAIACQGVLSELSHLGLLDLITYLAGVSGSTCDWWQDMVKAENDLRRRLREDSWEFSVALDGLCRAAERADYSLTDFWSYSLVYCFTKELLDTRLSSVKQHSDKGTVPYPIFATIDHPLKSSGKEKPRNSWFEFTPDWAGFSFANVKPGAYVSITRYGSKFKEGKLIQEEDERDFSYLRALCGSALADKDVILKSIKDFFLKFTNGASHQQKMLLSDSEGPVLKTIMEELFFLVYTFQTNGNCLPILNNLLVAMAGKTSFSEAEMLTNHMINSSLHSSPSEQKKNIEDLLDKAWAREIMESSSASCFLKFLWKTTKCILSWTWGKTNNFLYMYEYIKDKPLTDHESMYLMDAGLAINSAYPLVLPPMRNTDIILSFDFSEGDPFETVKATKKYCETYNIPFPPVDEAKLNQEAKAPSDLYIFQGEKTPVVLHFPLFNKVNCHNTETIDQRRKTYQTFRLSNYSEAEVDQLLKDAKANVRNNKDRILAKICEVGEAVL